MNQNSIRLVVLTTLVLLNTNANASLVITGGQMSVQASGYPSLTYTTSGGTVIFEPGVADETKTLTLNSNLTGTNSIEASTLAGTVAINTIFIDSNSFVFDAFVDGGHNLSLNVISGSSSGVVDFHIDHLSIFAFNQRAESFGDYPNLKLTNSSTSFVMLDCSFSNYWDGGICPNLGSLELVAGSYTIEYSLSSSYEVGNPVSGSLSFGVVGATVVPLPTSVWLFISGAGLLISRLKLNNKFNSV